MLDKRKGPGADGAGDPSKNDSTEHPSDSTEDNRSKVLSDYLEIIDFLEKLRPGGPWVLTAIDPASGKIETITAHNKIEALCFIRLHDGKRNLHYSVNPTRTAMTRKAAKTDIAAIEYLFADLDPRDDESPEDAKARYLAAIRAHAPEMAALIDSGNGLQVLLKLETRIELAEPVMETDAKGKNVWAFPSEAAAIIADVEARSAALMKRLGSVAGTQNIDRILRLPGTINLPNKTKRERGRVPCQTKLIHFNGATCKLSDFPNETAGSTAKRETGSSDYELKLDWAEVEKEAGWLKNETNLPGDFSAKGRMIFAHGGKLEDLNSDLKQAGLVETPYNSWSEVSLALAAIFKADGRFTLEKIAAALMGPLTCNQHVTKLKDAQKRRAVERLLSRSYEPKQTANGFVLNNKGIPVASQGNIRIAMKQLGVTVRHDAFQDRSTIAGLEGFELLDDRAIDRLWLTIDERFGFRPTREFLWTVVADEARRNCSHPVRDYLDGLRWDGQNRIDRWLINYAGADDTSYVRAVGALTLVAAVRRIRQPGCKFDEMPVFQSAQGLEKSSALSILAINPEWFSDDLPLTADSKAVIERLKGRWIVEAAELKGMRKSDIEHLKAFLSRTVDRARLSYDRSISELKRQCIIIGTTNFDEFLRDQTGNRRYWPVAVGAFDLAKLKGDRDQLWAEAAAREAQGVSIRLPRELWAIAAKEQEERMIDEPWIEVIQKALGETNGKLLTSDVWRIVNIPTAQRTQAHNERVGIAMRACGWKRKKVRFPVIGMQWAYVRGPKPYKTINLYTNHYDDSVTVNEPTEPEVLTARTARRQP